MPQKDLFWSSEELHVWCNFKVKQTFLIKDYIIITWHSGYPKAKQRVFRNARVRLHVWIQTYSLIKAMFNLSERSQNIVCGAHIQDSFFCVWYMGRCWVNLRRFWLWCPDNAWWSCPKSVRFINQTLIKNKGLSETSIYLILFRSWAHFFSLREHDTQYQIFSVGPKNDAVILRCSALN